MESTENDNQAMLDEAKANLDAEVVAAVARLSALAKSSEAQLEGEARNGIDRVSALTKLVAEKIEGSAVAVHDQLAATARATEEKLTAITKVAEDASAKAVSDSGFALNAKQNADEHAKAISVVRGTVDADFAWLTTTKKNAEEVAQAIGAAKIVAENEAKSASSFRDNCEKDSLATKAISDQVAATLPIIDSAKNNAANAFGEITKHAASIAEQRATIDASAGAIQTIYVQVTEVGTKASVDGASIAKAEGEAKTLLSAMNDTLATANTAHQRVVDYEGKLSSLRIEIEDLHKKIEGLLPGATSAGLASAFKTQQSRFKNPQKSWLVIFVVTILLLLAAGIWNLPGLTSSSANDSWESIIRHFVGRLPLVVPLVWIGIFAGRNYMLALRIEEEYAFKEAVSSAFEGYKREMSSIAGSGNNAITPIVSLCENVLRTLGQRPGRIYEGKHDDITPFSPITKTVADIVKNGSSSNQG